MSTELRTIKSFRKDYKKLSDAEIARTDIIIQKLLRDEPLEARHRDHALR